MDDKQTRLLRRIYSEIIKERSVFEFESKNVYIKHLNLVSQSCADEIYDQNYEKAVSRGVPCVKDRLDFLSKEGQWTDKDEQSLNDSQSFLEGLRNTKKNLYLKSQIAEQNKLIKEEEDKLWQKLNQKHSLIGTTADSYANKKLNEAYVQHSIYRDEECKIPFFAKEEYEELDLKDFLSLEFSYQKCLSKFNDKNIKSLALAVFFQNIYCLASEELLDFYGKPAVQLTFYQTDLVHYARFFKHILSGQHKPPQELMDDPDKVIDWYTSSGNLKKILPNSQKEGTASTIVGAKKEDLEALGISKHETVSLHGAAKKKGGGLTMQELMKLHGV